MHRLTLVLDAIDSFHDRFGEWLSYLMVPMLGIVLAAVLMRYVFSLPFEGSYEIAGFVFGAYVVLAGGYALLKGSHVRMDILFTRFSLRAQARLDIITSALFFIYAGAFLLTSLDFARQAVLLKEVSITGGAVPIWPIKLAMPVAGALLLLQGVSKLFRDIMVVARKK